MHFDISVIIVNYNGLHFFEKCIESIKEHIRDVSFEIIVVDNDSNDESCSYLKENYPEIKLIECNSNLGFGKANNLGVKNATGKHVLLLNNDTILLQNINPLLKEIARKEVGVIGIKMLNGNNVYTSSVGKFPKPLDLLKLSNLNDKRKEFITGEFSEVSYEVDWVSGSFMLLRREVWDSVNGFDEDFFMYVEDVDLCKRINKTGKKIIFISTINYIHFVGFNKSREIKLINGYRLYSRKHFYFINSTLAAICLKINYVYKKRVKNIC